MAQKESFLDPHGVAGDMQLSKSTLYRLNACKDMSWILGHWAGFASKLPNLWPLENSTLQRLWRGHGLKADLYTPSFRNWRKTSLNHSTVSAIGRFAINIRESKSSIHWNGK
jgi:hypothetical protein